MNKAKRLNLSVGVCAFFLGASIVSAQSATINNYLIIADEVSDNGEALNVGGNAELGAISAESDGGDTADQPDRFNEVSPPQGNPAFPATSVSGATVRGPETGVITRDGNVAIVRPDGTFSLSNTDVHTLNNGNTNMGAQGIECAGSVSNCAEPFTLPNPESGQDQDGNAFNTTALPAGPVFSDLNENNGVVGNVDFAPLLSELDAFTDLLRSGVATSVLNISGGNVQSDFEFIASPGLNIVDITTGGNDLSLNKANWITTGEADSFVVYRVEQEQSLISSNGNFLLGGDIGINNTLFLVDDDAQSFNFSNTEFLGYTFIDWLGILDINNEANFDNVRGCGQIITNAVVFNNVSMTRCSFDITQIPPPGGIPPNPVPVPAALPLFAGGLGLLGFLGWRRKRSVTPEV